MDTNTADKVMASHHCRLLRQARSGSTDARNELIRSFVPFVARVASRIAGRYLRPGEDDEISVGLIAFNEAIDSYDECRSTHFLAFSETVIRRRLIDHYRRIRNRPGTVSLDHMQTDDDSLRAHAFAHHLDQLTSLEARDEISRLSRLFHEFGLTFAMVARACPRRRDARLRQTPPRRPGGPRRSRRQAVSRGANSGGLLPVTHSGETGQASSGSLPAGI